MDDNEREEMVATINSLMECLGRTNSRLRVILEDGLPTRGQTIAKQKWHDVWWGESHDIVRQARESLYAAEAYR